MVGRRSSLVNLEVDPVQSRVNLADSGTKVRHAPARKKGRLELRHDLITDG